MATSQYIGARYVPLFHTAPDGSNNWTAGMAYDPLTIVTDLSQSYTSKIPVPATVGRPSENPEYWILTGAYNAQVEQYRQEVADYAERVETLTQKVDDLKGRNFLLIGDSFGSGVNGNGGSRVWGWYKWFESYMAGSGCGVYYDTGAGTYHGISGFTTSLPFLNMVKNCEEIYNYKKDEITDIVVIGGSNDLDINGHPEQIEAKISEFMAYIKANYPNARTRIGCMGTGITKIYQQAYDRYKQCTKYGAGFIANLMDLLCDPQFIGTDGVHLTQAGYEFYAPYIANEILVGDVDYSFGFNVELVPRSGVELSVPQGKARFEITVRPRRQKIYKFFQGQSYGPLRFKITTAPRADEFGHIDAADFIGYPNIEARSDAICSAWMSGEGTAGAYLTRMGRVYISTRTGETAPCLQINLSPHVGPAFATYTNNYLYLPA